MPISPFKHRDTRSYGEVQDKLRLRVVAKLKSGKFWKKFFKYGAVAGAGGLILFTGFVFWVSRELPDPNRLSERQEQSTKIYDRTGTHLLYEIFQNQKRTMVELDQMSPWIPKATVAIEDKRFYEHSGIRIQSILRAQFNNLIGRREGSGGASTLTQQLIKNAIVGDDHSYYRKIKEAILAIRLERKYSKDEILKMYLNEIPYGSTNYGVEAASLSYFNKNAKDLNLSESAALAALAKAPSRYLNNPEALKTRRDYVLLVMKEQGKINEEEYTKATEEAVTLKKNAGSMQAPHFSLYVKQLLAEQFGEKVVDTGGLKVITSLDFDKQKEAEKIVKEEGDRLAKEANANNASLVAIDAKTGQIIAMVGSRDYNNDEIDGQFNVAVLGKRQPGSSFKPFVYTAAFEKGFTPETMLYDVLTNFDMRTGGNYTPKNFNGKEYGLVTLRKALQGSLNIAAVKTLYLVGSKETIEFAKRFGYTTFTGDYGLSLVLGGAEVNLLEHTNGYATLANNGNYHAPVSILKVEDRSGGVMYEWKESDGSEAVKPEVAAITTGVLSDDAARAYVFGRGGNLTLPGRAVAAKTGTTNDNKDAWTLGYTPSIAAGVWVGNTTPSPMKGGGNALAGIIWNKFMRFATKDTPVENFTEPPKEEVEKPILRGSEGGIKLNINRLTGKIAASSTPEHLTIERTYLLPHDILHYVKKDDPRGPYPESPGDDPQYTAWEAALQSWVERNRKKGTEFTLEEPPTETDAPLDPALAPSLEILRPQPGETYSARQLDFSIKAESPRGIHQITYYIDSTQVGLAYTFPFSLSYHAATLSQGEHTLTVLAEDDLGNYSEKEIKFNLNAGLEPTDVTWMDGERIELTNNDFPRGMYLTPFRWEDIQDVKIYLSGNGGRRLIYTFTHSEALQNNKLFFAWKTFPGAGEHTLTAEMTDKTGRVVNKELKVVGK